MSPTLRLGGVTPEVGPKSSIVSPPPAPGTIEAVGSIGAEPFSPVPRSSGAFRSKGASDFGSFGSGFGFEDVRGVSPMPSMVSPPPGANVIDGSEGSGGGADDDFTAPMSSMDSSWSIHDGSPSAPPA